MSEPELQGIDDLLGVLREAGMPEETLQEAQSRTREALAEDPQAEDNGKALDYAPPIGPDRNVGAGSGVTKRQVGQMIRQAFERRVKTIKTFPHLDDLKDGQEVEVDLHPAQVGPGEPLGYERRRYVRRGDRLFFAVLEEVK